jgi:hypothetical protein
MVNQCNPESSKIWHDAFKSASDYLKKATGQNQPITDKKTSSIAQPHIKEELPKALLLLEMSTPKPLSESRCNASPIITVLSTIGKALNIGLNYLTATTGINYVARRCLSKFNQLSEPTRTAIIFTIMFSLDFTLSKLSLNNYLPGLGLGALKFLPSPNGIKTLFMLGSAIIIANDFKN